MLNATTIKNTLFIALLMIVVLILLGRSFYCSCGELIFWVGNPNSSHNSQHFLDCYSFSHFQHGLVFFWFLCLIKKPKLEYAILLEAGWEILENTPFIINRYRSETSALGYSGDTILNSCSDLLACGLGYYVASKFSLKATLLVFIIIEVSMLYLIKDSLLVNVIMLLYPIPAIKNWQLG